MAKDVPKRKFSGEFKQRVVEELRSEELSHLEIERRYGLAHRTSNLWERIYLEEGPEGLYEERRGRASSARGTHKGRSPKLSKKVEEDLIAENQRLRMEIDYLKKLNALVRAEEQQKNKKLK